jgi:hypothetical protein
MSVGVMKDYKLRDLHASEIKKHFSHFFLEVSRNEQGR